MDQDFRVIYEQDGRFLAVLNTATDSTAAVQINPLQETTHPPFLLENYLRFGGWKELTNQQGEEAFKELTAKFGKGRLLREVTQPLRDYSTEGTV